MNRRIPFVLLLVWIALAPVFLGSVPEANVGTGSAFARFLSAGGGYALFRAIGYVALGFLLPILLGGLRREPLAPAGGDRVLFPLVLLLVLGAIQLVPLPLGLLRLIAPAHAADAAALMPGRSWVPISVDPGLTREAIIRLFLLVVAGLAVLQTVRTPARAWWTLGVVAAVAAADAAYGIVEAAALRDTVLGFAKPGDAGAVTGTFFYRGNFAAFAAAGAGVAAAGLVTAFRRGRPALAAAAAAGTALLSAAVLLTRSRAGLVALGLAVGTGLVLHLRTWRARVLLGTIVLVAVVGGGLLFGSVRKRFEYVSESATAKVLDIRVPAWKSTLDLFSGRPVLGSGLGTFRRAIHLTQSPDVARELWFAHSDPLNLLAEGGVVGLLFGLAVAVLGLVGAVRLAGDGDAALGGAGAAAAAGLVGLLAMAAVDFPLQIPATSLLFAVLVFLPFAATAGPSEVVPARGLRRLLAGVVSIAAAGLLLVSVAEDLDRGYAHPGTVTEGEALRRRGTAELAAGEVDAAAKTLDEAEAAAPFDGEVRYERALAALARRDFDRWQAEIRAAHRLARGRAALLFDIGRAILANDRTMMDLGFASLKEAAEIEPKYWSRAVAEIPSGFLEAIAPEKGYAWAQLADRRAARNDRRAAIDAYWRAIDLGEGGDVVRRLAATYRAAGLEPEGRRAFARRSLPWPD